MTYMYAKSSHFCGSLGTPNTRAACCYLHSEILFRK